jgi:hypothetical protein
VLQLACERRRHVRLRGGLGAAQRAAGGGERRDEVGAGHREARADAVKAQCDRAKEVRIAARCGLGPCGVEQLSRVDGVTGVQSQVRFDGE